MDQFDCWMETIVDKLKQARQEFQMKLAEFDRHIEANREVCKRFMIDRIGTTIRSVLMEQIHKDEINGSEVEKAAIELVYAQKLLDSLNCQPLITVSSAADNHMDFKIPCLVFPSISVYGFDWMTDYHCIGNTAGIMGYCDQQHVDIPKSADDRSTTGTWLYFRFRVEKHSAWVFSESEGVFWFQPISVREIQPQIPETNCFFISNLPTQR